MQLSQLCQGFTDTVITSTEQVKGLTCSSGQVQAGYVFFAIPGFTTDGAVFAPQAQEKGAIAVVAVRPLPEVKIPVIVVKDIRKTMALMAHRFYGADALTLLGITGTNGKTSVVSYVRQLMSFMGTKAASIGTIGVGADFPVPGAETAVQNTTADPITLNKNLRALADAGAKVVALEYTSVGLDQDRTAGLVLQGAGFTNFTQDHLDYHKTMENYLACKLKIFENVREGGWAVLNADIPEYPVILQAAQRQNLNIFSVGRQGTTLTLKTQQLYEGGQRLTLDYKGTAYALDLPIFGDFQAMNILQAVGLCAATGADVPTLLELCPRLVPPTGRLECVRTLKNGAKVFVDYAHTPDALERALLSLRAHATGRLVCVFGCGGNRDTTKRPIMGKIAQEKADVVYITDDNPRNEDAASIRQMILEACPKGIEVGNRAAAICQSLTQAQAGDIIIIAGKGHEDYQLIQGTKYPFSDTEQVLMFAE